MDQFVHYIHRKVCGSEFFFKFWTPMFPRNDLFLTFDSIFGINSPPPCFYGLIIIFLVSGMDDWSIVNFIIFSFSVKNFCEIVRQNNFAHPHWQTVENVVQTSSRIPFVFARKPTTLRVLLVSLLLLVYAKRSHHVRITLRVRLHVRFVRVDKA